MNRRKQFRFTVKNDEIKIAFVYLIYVKPGMLEDIAMLDILWNLGRFGLTIVFIGLLFANRKNLSAIRFPLLICMSVFLSTFLHKGNMTVALGHWVPILGLIAWAELNKNKIKNIVQEFFHIGGILIILNLVTVLAFPSGIWKRNNYTPIWLLGQKQDFITCVLSTMFFGILTCYLSNKIKRYFYLVLTCIVISLVIVKPLGLIGCMLIFVGLVFTDKIMKKNIRMDTLMMINVAAEILAIIIAYTYSNLLQLQSLLAGLVNTGMDKSQTMGIRFQMWTRAGSMVLKHPLLGLGQVTEEMWYELSNLNFYHTIMHNMPLDIALTGGGV